MFAMMREGANPMLIAAREFNFRRAWKLARRYSKFYLQNLADIDEAQLNLDKLAQVPVVTRSEVARNDEDFRRKGVFPSGHLFSSGTSGTALRIGVLPGLETFVETHFALEGSAERKPLIMRAVGSSNGTAPLRHKYVGALAVPLRSRGGYLQAWQIASSTHQYDGYRTKVEHLVLPLPALKKFVHLMLEESFDPGSLSLDSIVSYATYLSSGWRAKIEKYLAAPMQNIFGFTEIPHFSAAWCAACQAFHSDADSLVEILDVDSGLEVGIGELGKLVVTSLRPDLTDLPLLRYACGDLAESRGFCNIGGDRGFVLKGREADSIALTISGKTRFVLLPFDVQEVIDCEPWPVRLNSLRHNGVTRTEDESYPKWRAQLSPSDDGTPRLELQFEVRFSPMLFSDSWRPIRDSVRARILASSATLSDAVAAGDLRFEVVGLTEGSLAAHEIVRC